MTTQTDKTALELFLEKNGTDVTSYTAAQIKEFQALKKAEDAKNTDDLKRYNEICAELGLEPSKNVKSLFTREIKSKEKVVRIEVGIAYHLDNVPYQIVSGLSPKTENLNDVIKNRHTKFVMALSAIES